MAKQNEPYYNSEYWEDRIANETWKTYNDIEEKNMDLLRMYEKSSQNIKNELLALAEKAEREGGLGRSDQYRFNKLLGEQGEIFKECERLGEQIEKHATNHMIAGGKATYKNVMEALGETQFHMPNKKVMEQMLRSPWHGSFFSERLWRDMGKLERNLNGVISNGISTGKTITEMAVQLSNIMQSSFNDAHRLVRTETINYLNRSELLAYKKAGVGKVQWWAAQDERTCPTCGANHERKYPIDKTPNLPCHPGCRCTWLPVIDSIDESNEIDFAENDVKIKVAEGSNMVGRYQRREGYEYEIEDILNQQGFDGRPRVIKTEKEFYELVDKDHFIAERTFSDDNSKKQIDEWYDQLKNGDFYVKCKLGGFQYGRGMYCAADYTKGTIDYSKFQHEIDQYTWGKKYAKTTWLTMDPSAKIINYLDIQDEYALKLVEVNNPGKENAIKQYIKLRNELRDYPRTWDPVYGAAPKEFTLLSNEVRQLDKELGFSQAIMQTNLRIKNDGYDYGILAAEMGYDAINGAGHGATGSYTVVLNRTKLILYDSDNFIYRKK